MSGYRHLSFWHDTLPEGDIQPRRSLEGAVKADVAIVGAGYTGLWTAYYLSSLQPDLKVVVVEAEVAGFGAAGRNGGWCIGEMAGDPERLAASHGRGPVVAMTREMFATVDEVGKVATAEGIDCHFHKGGMLTMATNPAQAVRLQEQIEAARHHGWAEEDLRWMDKEEALNRARVEGSRGALFSPHAAAIHPARLARGLAEVVERKGVTIYENTPALMLSDRQVITAEGGIRAPSVLLCTEAFTIQLPGLRRELVPLYSLMVSTEPLPPRLWAEIGLENRELFNDRRNLIIYGQRTADGRIAFGGRGAGYHYGSALHPRFDQNPPVHRQVVNILRSLLPPLKEVAVTHRWGGAVAMPRDWQPSVRYDRATGTGWAGGYIGEGVAASNLAGRTLADLVLGRDTELVRLPWVGHVSPKWEPEPFRWLGVNLGLKLAPAADRAEARTGRRSRFFGGALRLLTGR